MGERNYPLVSRLKTSHWLHAILFKLNGKVFWSSHLWIEIMRNVRVRVKPGETCSLSYKLLCFMCLNLNMPDMGCACAPSRALLHICSRAKGQGGSLGVEDCVFVCFPHLPRYICPAVWWNIKWKRGRREKWLPGQTWWASDCTPSQSASACCWPATRQERSVWERDMRTDGHTHTQYERELWSSLLGNGQRHTTHPT